MQMYILDGKAFAGLEESGQQHSEHAVDECMLLANNQVSMLSQACWLGKTSYLNLFCQAMRLVWINDARQPWHCKGDRLGA